MSEYQKQEAKVRTFGFHLERTPIRAGGQLEMHNEIELLLVEEGSFVFLVGAKHYQLKAGQLLFFWGISPHYAVETEGLTNVYWLAIPLRIFLNSLVMRSH